MPLTCPSCHRSVAFKVDLVQSPARQSDPTIGVAGPGVKLTCQGCGWIGGPLDLQRAAASPARLPGDAHGLAA